MHTSVGEVNPLGGFSWDATLADVASVGLRAVRPENQQRRTRMMNLVQWQERR